MQKSDLCLLPIQSRSLRLSLCLSQECFGGFLAVDCPCGLRHLLVSHVFTFVWESSKTALQSVHLVLPTGQRSTERRRYSIAYFYVKVNGTVLDVLFNT